MSFAKLLYGAFFTLVLPALLMLWARGAEPNVSLPLYGSPLIGYVIACGGFTLMAAALTWLWRFGEGLPMNAFPPKRLVSTGVFRWIPHPVYTGFTAIGLGISMAAGSASGLWLVTPAIALGCAALVFGYEHPDMRRRLGDTLHLLPPDETASPTTVERVRFYVVVVVPWLALYAFSVNMGLQGIAFRFPFEQSLPIYPWTSVVYQSCYVTVALAPWCARTRRDLRRLMISGWVATVLIFPVYWILPSSAPRRAMVDESWIAHLLAFERQTYPPSAAFPSFHMLWAIFVGRLFKPRWTGVLYASAVGVSCITTGMHYIPDILASIAIAPFLLHPERPWRRLLRLTGRLANSWREWRIGPVRIINHAFYAALATFVQVLTVCSALETGHEGKVIVTAIAGLLGAAVWAQWVEGSSLLRRPFGFYGGLIAVAIACCFFQERWLLLAAHCLGAPWMQAVGRLRCLVNGCCHGAPAPEAVSIRVVNQWSRVTRLAGLGGIGIHPTQLYSILGNLFLGLVLLRLWISGCPLSLVAGVYALGNGISRFVEEAYRGEPQTAVVWGLPLYQWLAIGTIATGAWLTTLPSAASPALAVSGAGVLAAFGCAVLSGAAMGVDFPESDRPFSRLT